MQTFFDKNYVLEHIFLFFGCFSAIELQRHGAGAAVDPCTYDTVAGGVAPERRPAAEALHVGVGDGVRLGEALHEHEVGIVAGFEPAAATDAEECGGSLGHAQGHGGGVEEVEHRHERELCHRGAGCGMEHVAGLVGKEVGRMVGGDDVEPAVEQGAAQCVAVGGGLDGGIHLDACAQARVVVAAMEQVVGRHLGGDGFAGGAGGGVEQGCLGGGGDVGHVEAGSVARGEPEGALGGAYAGLG